MSTANQLIYTGGTVAIDTTGDVITLKNVSGTSVGVISNSQLSLSRNGHYVLYQGVNDTYLYSADGYRLIYSHYDGSTMDNNTLTISRSGSIDVLNQSKTSMSVYDSTGSQILYAYCDGNTVNNILILSRGSQNDVLSQNTYDTHISDSTGSDFIYVHSETNTASNSIDISRGGNNDLLYQDATTTTLSNSAGTAILTATTSAQTLLASSLSLTSAPTTTTAASVYVKGTDGKLKEITIAALKALLA